MNLPMPTMYALLYCSARGNTLLPFRTLLLEIRIVPDLELEAAILKEDAPSFPMRRGSDAARTVDEGDIPQLRSAVKTLRGG